MRALRYPLAFVLVIIALTVATLVAYDRISETSLSLAAPSAAVAADPEDSEPAPRFAPAGPADYEAFNDEDNAWRARNAQPFTLAALRARGDGRRTLRQLMQDRVFRHTQRGQRGQAIAELQRWVVSNPGDQAAILSLARLLNETGRTDDAVKRYRQLLALQERGRQ